jgi:eukaryotic-like serine/threonine-protein kinase
MSTNEKLVPGMVLGRYELLLPIAQGGMATVWAARQKGSRGFMKTVAIKTMLPALSEDPQFEQMFLDEAALAAKIHHPNVAEILDLGEQDEILYIVMEWVDGEALSVIHKASRKNQAQVPVRLSMRIAMQACAGLHAAHELKDENETPLLLVHRDVSPQNVLVTYDGIVKLVDFGVAKAVGRASGETNAGQLKGKVPYMSPEQARGGTVDRRTDIFAMGIVLYKMATGIHPFLGENDLVTMRNIISRPLLPPRVKNPGFPPEVEQILIKCLQKDPEKRYQTMSELGTAVERSLGAMGIADDDLGAYVRTLMGDRGAKRRAAIRDAARAADERFATGTYPSPVATPQTVHEGVSEVVLTKMSSGVKEEILSERPSILSAPPASASQPTQSGAWSQPQPEPSGTTDQPVVAPEDLPAPPRRSRSGVFVAAGLAVAAAIVGVVVLRSGGSSARDHGTPTVQAAQQPPVTATAVAPPPPPPLPPPEPSSTAAASASASSTAVSVSSLPDAQPPSPSPQQHKPGPTPPAPNTKPTADKPPPRSGQPLPTFTSPGF